MFYLLIFFSFALVVLFRVNFILVLLLLELVLLCILCFSLEISSFLMGSVNFFFLLGMVCMGAYGISILVFSSRFWGKDDWWVGVIV